MRKVLIPIVIACMAVAGLAWAANHVVTIFWAGPGNPIQVNPDPVVVNDGDTVEFQLSPDSWGGGVCAVTAGPPLNWNIGPLYPGYPGIQTPPINVPPGTYEYLIECGEAKIGQPLFFGTVVVQGQGPVFSTWALIALVAALAALAIWSIHRRRLKART